MPAVLSVRSLTKCYGRTRAVEDVTFEVSAGEVVVLVGPNGSGKTTTIECCAGLRTPSSGLVEVGGEPRGRTRVDRSWVGVQLQESALAPAMSPREALTLVASLYRDPLPLEFSLESVGLERSADVRYEELSGGQKRRLHVALAVVGRPALVILDEPTSGVDPEGRSVLWDMLGEVLRSSGAGLLLTTHDLNEAEDRADRLLLLRNGRIQATGRPTDLLARVGGPWRIRVKGAPSELRALVAGAGLRFAEERDYVTVFGEQSQIIRLREVFENRGATDLLVGPSRLEDLYSLESRAS